MKRRFSFILAIVIILLNVSVYADIGIEDELRSYLLADAETGRILEAHNIDQVVEIASISKIMTYILVMDSVNRGDISLDDIILVDKDTERVNGSTFKLREGQTFRVEDLLKASMVVSGNDATYALAKHVAGTEANFANMMTMKAREIGLENAVFYNSTGLPIYPQDIQNMMTTRELFELSNYILKNYPEILEISSLKAVSDADRDFFQWNSNPLIPRIKEVDGLKTGFTNRAGYCHVATFTEEAKDGVREDLRLISIVMGAEDLETRNKTSELLVRYGLNNYEKKVFLDPERAADTLFFEDGKVQEIDVFPDTKFAKLVNKDEDIEVQVDFNSGVKLPIKKDQVVGEARIVENGETIYQTNIRVRDKFAKANFFVIIGRKIKSIFD